MTEKNKTLFIQTRYDLTQIKRSLMTYFGKLLPLILLISLSFCLFTHLLVVLGRFRLVSIPDTASPRLVFSFCSAVVAFVSSLLFSLCVNVLFITAVFVPLALVTWVVVVLALNLIYRLFYSVDSRQTILSKRYDSFFSYKLRRVSFVIGLAFLIIFTIATLATIKSRGISGLLMVHLLGIACCVAVLVTFGFHWCFFLRTLERKEKEHRKIKHFQTYLFSEKAIKGSFLISIKAMVYLALLAWLLIPLPAEFSTKTAQWTKAYLLVIMPEYEVVSAEAQQTFILQSGHEWDNTLPSYAELEKSLDMWAGLREVICPQYGSATFLKYLFFIVALVSLAQVALPAMTRATRHRGYGKAVRNILVASVKTTTVVFLLKLFVEKAFLIDFSSTLGMGTVFTYILAGFLAFQNRPEENAE